MRLRHPLIRSAAAPVAITVDGVAVDALPGESVAAALTAAGIRALRHTRSGSRRGVWCGMGACFECLVTIDGKANQRACLAMVEAGMVVRTQVPAGTGDDPLQPLTPEPAAAPEERACDVLVVGAGPAGLAAALAAARAGAETIILDERSQPGGQYFKPLGHSQTVSVSPDAQFAAGRDLVVQAEAAGVRLIGCATVWGVFASDEVAALVDGRSLIYRPRRLILATGAFERPVPIPGWTLPGVMTTGAAQTLARAYRVAPGERVVIAGNGPLNLQVAVELLEGGAKIAAVVESAQLPVIGRWRAALGMVAGAPDLVRDGVRYLARLALAGVPVLWGQSIVGAEGDRRFERAIIARVDTQGRKVPGTERVVVGDALCLGYGFVPSTELTRMLGARHRFVDRHLGFLAVATGEGGETSVPGVYAVGDGADLGGARVALARGTLTGTAAAASLGLAAEKVAEDRARRALDRATAFQEDLWTLYCAPPGAVSALADEVVVCRCEEVTAGDLRKAMAVGFTAAGPLKRLTRAGMGRCQGRYCAATIARLCAAADGSELSADSFFAPRPPAKPVPAGALAFEKPEWGGHRRVDQPRTLAFRSVRAPDTPGHPYVCDVLVVGGGALGCCTALYLARAGIDVLVAERDEVNLQASGGNAGSLHVQLLSFDFGAKAQAGGGPAAETLPLGPEAVRLWQAIEAEAEQSLEIRITGGLMLAETEAELRFLDQKAALERAYGIETGVIGAADLRSLAPALSARFIGAAHCPIEGKINPLVATYAVMRLATAAGARFLRGAEVRAITRDRAGFRVRTSAGEIHCGRIVNAAGGWSPRVAAMVGVDLPVKGAPLQMIVTEPAPPLVDHLIAHADRHLSLKQAAAGGLIIGGGWPGEADPATGATRTIRTAIEGNLWVATRVLPALAGLHVIRSWAAMNVNIDGAPIMGPVPGVEGFFHAVTSNGYTLAPVVGRMVATMIASGKVPPEAKPYLIDRFG